MFYILSVPHKPLTLIYLTMLKELRTQHRTIIQMVFSGFKNNEIAERLEMTPSTVSQIIRSPLGQAYLEGLQDKAQEATLDVRKKLVSLNKDALSTLERLVNPREKAAHSVQLGAAKDILDRNGYKAPDKLHVDMTLQTKTDQEIDAEIAAMQSSISKTYLQDPVKPEVTEHPVTSDDIDLSQNMDSPESSPVSSPAVSDNHHSAVTTVPGESIVTQIDQLDKLPENLFQDIT